MLAKLRSSESVHGQAVTIWKATVHGQPPSQNHSYRPVKLHKKDQFGRPMYTPDGRAVTRIGMAKETNVAEYQTGAAWEVRATRPSGWQHGGGWIRISYCFWLLRRVDCDNAMKALNDAVALAIGVDDFFFLPCVTSKSVNSKEPDPRVELVIEDLSGSLSLPPTPSLRSASRRRSTPG